MTDSKNCGCSDITGVNCDVTNCKYNTIDCIQLFRNRENLN